MRACVGRAPVCESSPVPVDLYLRVFVSLFLPIPRFMAGLRTDRKPFTYSDERSDETHLSEPRSEQFFEAFARLPEFIIQCRGRRVAQPAERTA